MAEAARAVVAPMPGAGAGRRTRGVPRLAVIAGVAALLAVAVAVAALRTLDEDPGLDAIDENHVGLIDADSGDITEQIAVGRDPSAVATGGGSMWVANARDQTVSRIERERGQVVAIPVGRDPTGLTFAAGSVWITSREDRTLSQLNVATNRVVNTTPLGNAPRAVAGGFGALWIASEIDRKLTPFDLSRGDLAPAIDLGAAPTAVATGAGAVWVASEEAGTVFRIEPRSRTVVKAIPAGKGPIGVAVGEGGVWVANRQDATVSRIDPATDAVTDVIDVGRDPSAVVAGAGSVWVANGADGTVSRIEPASRRVTDTIPVVSSPAALAIDGGSVWTTALASRASHRGGTLRVAMYGPSFGDNIEPGGYSFLPINLLTLAYDGLVAYRRAGGSTFGTLVGDLATDVPKPSPDGRTYVFTLRRGIRYSDGGLVQPDDFRASLEDLLERHGKNIPPFYEKIAGAPGCVRTPRRCDLSDGIETDRTARTITVRLTAPDPELMHKLAFPFAYLAPADQPFRPKVPPPGTGPYRIVDVDFERAVRLVRNPHFRVWSHDARPDGFADEIEVALGDDVHAQVAAVQRGAGDVVTASHLFGGPLSPAELRAVRAQSAGQLHTDAGAELDFMWLNVLVPPFDHAGVRRAINFATDRRKIVELAGGPDLAQLTCQLLPPGMPGYVPSCPYTASPSAGGGWSAPALGRARRLIERSGTKGMKVTVWTYELKRSIGRYFVTLLRRLGYRSSLRVFPDYGAYGTVVADSRTEAQIGINGWSADVETPSNFAAPLPLLVLRARGSGAQLQPRRLLRPRRRRQGRRCPERARAG